MCIKNTSTVLESMTKSQYVSFLLLLSSYNYRAQKPKITFLVFSQSLKQANSSRVQRQSPSTGVAPFSQFHHSKLSSTTTSTSEVRSFFSLSLLILSDSLCLCLSQYPLSLLPLSPATSGCTQGLLLTLLSGITIVELGGAYRLPGI